MSIADKLTTVAENQEKVYEAGKKSEYDAFWNAHTENGNRKSYYYAFFAWKASMFYPKDDIVFTNQSSSSCFYNLNQYGSSYCDYDFDFSTRLEECNVILDTSQATNLGYLFSNVCSLSVPAMDARNCTSFVSMFSSSYIETIGEIWLSDTNASQNFTNMFSGSNNERLKNITFKGVIASNIDFKTCSKLTHDSLMSIVNALKDYSDDTSGTTHTITLGATNISKMTDDELNMIEEKGWNYL